MLFLFFPLSGKRRLVCVRSRGRMRFTCKVDRVGREVHNNSQRSFVVRFDEE